MAGSAARSGAGFFGKVASQGDFVASRFDRTLRSTIDGWLQRSIAQSRDTLGQGWAPAFEAMPLWRFLLTPGLVGRGGFAGVMMPSRDRVGRHFPLILAAPADPATCARLSTGPQDWFETAEAALLAARDEKLDLGRFDRVLAALDAPMSNEGGEAAVPKGRSFWWTTAGIPQQRFSAPGLPAPEHFSRFLGVEPTASNVVPLRPAQTPPSTPSPLLRAEGASHPGTRLRIDASAMTKARRGDLHALAQGLGEGQRAAQAAASVIERLGRIAPAAALDDLVAQAKGALGSANTLLRRGEDDTVEAGASVVVLLAAEGRQAVLWAGDLRCYLLRDGLMRCLTRDHVEIGMRRRVSRSVGGSPQFSCDVVIDVLQPGDRFLLTGADLARLLGEREMAGRLAEPALTGVPAALVEDALIAGSNGNIAVLAIAASTASEEAAA